MKKRFSILRNERNANLFIIGVFLFVAIFLTWPLYINDRMILGVDAFFIFTVCMKQRCKLSMAICHTSCQCLVLFKRDESLIWLTAPYLPT